MVRQRHRIAVVGGGIAGLAAALRLVDVLGDRAEVVLIEATERLGGKIRTVSIAGRTVEAGAEMFLTREADDPSGAPSAAVRLAHRLELGDALRYPTTTAAAILTDGRLQPIPADTLMGIPSTLDGQGGGRGKGAADLDTGRPLLATGADIAVGALVRARFGDAVVDQLVDPLLGGVYAGRADDLSLAVTMPGLAEAARTEHTLAAAVLATLARRAPAASPARSSAETSAGTSAGLSAAISAVTPAFATVEGGLSRLIEAAVHALPTVRMKLGQPVRRLEAGPDGYQLLRGPAAWPAQIPPNRMAPDWAASGSAAPDPAAPDRTARDRAARESAAPDRAASGRIELDRGEPDRIEPDRIQPNREPETLLVDAVLLAVPAHPAARLLAGVSPDAAAAVGALDYASVALVTMLLPPGALDGTGLAGRSGALVPAKSGHLVKAITIFSNKWTAQPDGAVLLRASVGRYQDADALRLDDASLTAAVVDDLAKIVGAPLPSPLLAGVTRWGGALPQYRPGHLDRVAAARAALPPTLAHAGAAYDGVGIPACIRSAEAAADRLIGALT